MGILQRFFHRQKTEQPQDEPQLDINSKIDVMRSLIASSPMPGAPSSFIPRASPYPIYHWDKPYVFSVPITPQRRPGSLVTVDTLRQLAESYDVLRACILHIRREITAVPIEIVARDDSDKSDVTMQRIKEAEKFFDVDGGLGGRGHRRQHFEGEVIEDLCVVGASAVYFAPTLSGKPYEVIPVDAATIRPKVDAFGWPGPGQACYEQWVYGVKVAEYTREELRYDGIYSVSYSPYFKSPVEYLINVVNSALRADDWNRRWLTDGNTPSDIMALPDTWTPQQIMEWSDYWDGLLAGDSAGRQKTKWVPGGTTRLTPTSRKDQDFEAFELWLLRRTCAIMGVTPASIGFAGEEYKVAQEGSMKATTEFGVGVVLNFRKALYDYILERLGYPELEVRNVTAQGEEAATRASRINTLINIGVMTINEARNIEGLDPIDGGDVPLIGAFVQPLANILRPPQAQGAIPGAAPGALTDSGGEGGEKSPSDALGMLEQAVKSMKGEAKQDKDAAALAKGSASPNSFMKKDDKDGKVQNETGRAEGIELQHADVRTDLLKWERKAIKRVKSGKTAAVEFESPFLPDNLKAAIMPMLQRCTSPSDVRQVFTDVIERIWATEPLGETDG